MSSEPISLIKVWFTVEDLTKVRQAAEACGMTTEEFALWAAVNRAEEVIDPLRAVAR